jgi:DNA-binding LytR/AlgR family response regulator
MSHQIKCIIIDDEPVAIEIIKDYVDKTNFLKLLETFREPLKAIEFLQRNKVDLIFLDINMPDISGMQFLNALQTKPLVIFTTAYSEFAVESYEFDATDYILKPIEFTRFLKAANKAFEQHNIRSTKSVDDTTSHDADYILIKSSGDFHKTKVSDILYIKGAGNYILVYTDENEIITLSTMPDILKRLPSNSFLRIHKSFIINFNKVDVIEKEQVKIKNKYIPIGETFRKNLDFFMKKNIS